jgi:hypothetical protein
MGQALGRHCQRAHYFASLASRGGAGAVGWIVVTTGRIASCEKYIFYLFSPCDADTIGYSITSDKGIGTK